MVCAMKRLSAILLSLLLMGTQAVLVAQPPTNAGTRSACKCCDCGKVNCCVTPTHPGSAPAPAAPVRANTQNELSAFTLTLVAWTLPAAARQQISIPSISSSSRLATGVPLFTRHCALLV